MSPGLLYIFIFGSFTSIQNCMLVPFSEKGSKISTITSANINSLPDQRFLERYSQKKFGNDEITANFICVCHVFWSNIT